GEVHEREREEAWGSCRRVRTDLSHCSSCTITGLLVFCEVWSVEPPVGTGFSSARGRFLDKPLALSFVGSVASPKTDVIPFSRRLTESRLEAFTGCSSNCPCDCAAP